MIDSKESLNAYLEADAQALGVESRKVWSLVRDPIWRFQWLLRHSEWASNVGANRFTRFFWKYWKRSLGLSLGFTIPENVFGPGLAIAHVGTIVVNKNSRVGKNCRLHVCTNIGTSPGRDFAPEIGDNCYIGPGAKLYGNIIIGSNCAIGANAVVGRSFEESGLTIAGVPAKVVSSKGSADFFKIKAVLRENSGGN